MSFHLDVVRKRRRTAHSLSDVRAEDLAKKSLVKHGRRIWEAHSFDKQRHIAIDFDGSLEKISIMRSIEIGDAEPSLPVSEVFDSVLRSDTLFSCCVFMAVA